jgi:hypothetical protein
MFLKKSTTDKSKIKNIVTVDAYNNKSYLFKNNTFQASEKLGYNKSNFVTSYLGNKDIITTTVEISRSIPEEDISDILDIKAYEELGLDQAKNYTISYVESETEDEERKFHLFVAEPENLEDLFLPLKKQTKYFDLIVPAPLLYKSLYSKEILSSNGTHSFIYFTQNDAFITFYHDGEYLYSKSLDFSLEQIYERYCEIIGEQVDRKEFFSTFETEGLKAIDSEYQENLMKIFSEVFITINDIIIYAKRAFQLDAIDHMFIGSINGPVIGLDEYGQNYLGLQSSDFNFNYEINNDEWYTDQLQYLMLLNALEYMEDPSFTVNLTMFPRPPMFAKRASGQFILATAASIFIGIAYPLTYLIGSYTNEAKIYTLNLKNAELTKETKKYKKILSEKKKKISALDKEIATLLKTYNAKSKTLSSIYDKKVHYRLKSGIFYTFAKELDQFGVHIDNIYTKENTVWVALVSSNDRKFTELIQYISNQHFDELKSINIELIQKDPESNFYKGLLKVDLK